MRTDRSLRLAPTVVALALTALALGVWLPGDWLTPRGVQAQSTEEQSSITYPLAWGRFVTSVYNANTDTYTWYFEAPDGTIRAVDRRTRKVYVYLRR
jgi:hypothetical protein